MAEEEERGRRREEGTVLNERVCRALPRPSALASKKCWEEKDSAAAAGDNDPVHMLWSFTKRVLSLLEKDVFPPKVEHAQVSRLWVMVRMCQLAKLYKSKREEESPQDWSETDERSKKWNKLKKQVRYVGQSLLSKENLELLTTTIFQEQNELMAHSASVLAHNAQKQDPSSVSDPHAFAYAPNDNDKFNMEKRAGWKFKRKELSIASTTPFDLAQQKIEDFMRSEEEELNKEHTQARAYLNAMKKHHEQRYTKAVQLVHSSPEWIYGLYTIVTALASCWAHVEELFPITAPNLVSEEYGVLPEPSSSATKEELDLFRCYGNLKEVLTQPRVSTLWYATKNESVLQPCLLLFVYEALAIEASVYLKNIKTRTEFQAAVQAVKNATSKSLSVPGVKSSMLSSIFGRKK